MDVARRRGLLCRPRMCRARNRNRRSLCPGNGRPRRMLCPGLIRSAAGYFRLRRARTKVAPSRRWPARFKPASGVADGFRIVSLRYGFAPWEAYRSQLPTEGKGSLFRSASANRIQMTRLCGWHAIIKSLSSRRITTLRLGG